MTSGRVLRGVVNDLATSFVGRNNDFDGYWAIGLLRSFADRHGIRRINFDVLAGHAEPRADLTESVAAGYAGWLRKRLSRIGLPLERVSRAELDVNFGVYDGSRVPPQITRGEPFMCSVLLVDDHGRDYQRALSSWCDLHDASREWRRAAEHRGLGG